MFELVGTIRKKLAFSKFKCNFCAVKEGGRVLHVRKRAFLVSAVTSQCHPDRHEQITILL